jgi:LPXTG-site transpeptidase (sortase) family protein
VKGFRLSRLDKGTLIAGVVATASAVALAVGLFFVIAAASDDGVVLPSEGSLDEILEDEAPEKEKDTIPSFWDIGSGSVPQGLLPVRVVIPGIYVDAPIIVLGLGSDRYPEVPDRGDQVAWYNFSATPGLSNNAVFSGHVDWQTRDGDPVPGVFYRLKELRIGDEVSVTLEDNTVLQYRVTGNVATVHDDPNIVRSMDQTSADVITLITCGGSWQENPSLQNGGTYTHRIVVRAELVRAAVGAAG